MLKFDNWALIADVKLLARERDNLTTTLLVSGDLPQGWAWDLLITAGQNRNIIRLEEMTGGVGVVLTAEMLAEQGYYRMQLRGTRGEEVKHTNITSVYVGESMSGDKMWPIIPSEFTQLEARVNADADRAEDAAQAAEDAAIRQPYPNPDTGTWWTWDAETGAYKDTGEPYSGGGSGEAGQDGGYYAPSVDDDGNLTWTPSKDDMPQVEGANIKGPAGPQGPAGADGKDGAQGPQGEQGVQGPPGEKGDTGPQGEKGDKGDTGAQGPKGDTGETGPAGATGATPNLQIGEVTTLDAGSDATASITGTAENPLLNLGIPKGADGRGGSEKAWTLLGSVTLDENVVSVTMPVTNCREYLVLLDVINDDAGNAGNRAAMIVLNANGLTGRVITSGGVLAASGKRAAVIHVNKVGDNFGVGYSFSNSNGNGIFTGGLVNASSTNVSSCVWPDEVTSIKITNFNESGDYYFGVGSKFEIYGR